MPGRPKNTGTWGVNTSCGITLDQALKMHGVSDSLGYLFDIPEITT